jgi:hypothetical protein
VTFILVMGALKEVVSDRLGGDAPAVRADWRFRAAYMKEVLVKWGMTGTKLCQ